MDNLKQWCVGLPWWTPLVVFLFAFALGGALCVWLQPTPQDSDFNPNCTERYPLLRNDLDCQSADQDYSRINNIQEMVTSFIEREKAGGNVSRVSVFFRDLNSRRFASINADETFAPGSLLKLPLAIAYYKIAEVDARILDQEFQFQPVNTDANNAEVWKPTVPLEPGKIYNIKELIAHALIYSDNEAALQLNNSIDGEYFNKTLTDLGITVPKNGEQNFISVKTYSSVFRSLYLASYLNIDHSQELLDTMTKASFTQGLLAGLPSDTRVAHKFGERELVNNTSREELSAQLHDCGIVYKPQRPYILCVMTEGKNHEHLASVIAEISRIVYGKE